MNCIAISTRLQITLPYVDFILFGQIPRNEMTGSSGGFIFRILRDLHTVCYDGGGVFQLETGYHGSLANHPMCCYNY